jgi:hypothetical protein
LGKKRRLVTLWAWDILCPKTGFFPHIAQTFDIIPPVNIKLNLIDFKKFFKIKILSSLIQYVHSAVLAFLIDLQWR